MKKNLMVLSGFTMSFAPMVAFAQITLNGSSSACTLTNTSSTLFNLLCQFGALLNSVVPVLIALGVVFFVYGVVMYVIADDEAAKEKGRNTIIAGIIGLAVIVAVWGLVGILIRTFAVANTGNVTLPTVPVIIPTP